MSKCHVWRLSDDLIDCILQWCDEKTMVEVVRTCKELRRWKGNPKFTKLFDEERKEKTYWIMFQVERKEVPVAPYECQLQALREMLRVIHWRMPAADRRIHLEGRAHYSGKSTTLRLLIQIHALAEVYDFPDFIVAFPTKRQRDFAHKEFRALDWLSVDCRFYYLELMKQKIRVRLCEHADLLLRHTTHDKEVVLIDDLWLLSPSLCQPLPNLLKDARAVISTGRPQPSEHYTPPWRVLKLDVA